MNRDEFKSRTEAFLAAEEIERYETDFEPAYMATEWVSKDDFCEVLKDSTVKVFVRDMSHALVKEGKKLRDAARRYSEAVELLARAEERADGYRKSLSLISATCDKAFATAG